MPALQDPELRARYWRAVENWQLTGYVEWSQPAWDWVRKNLPGVSLKEIAGLMCRHVAAGGPIDRVPEHRPEWSARGHRYDLRLPAGGRSVTLETLLLDDDPEDPVIYVVSIHDA
jgi:hypothetical protein